MGLVWWWRWLCWREGASEYRATSYLAWILPRVTSYPVPMRLHLATPHTANTHTHKPIITHPGGAAPPLASRWNHLAASSARGGASAPLYLFPLPPDYERALQRRLGLTHDMRSKFKQVGGGGWGWAGVGGHGTWAGAGAGDMGWDVSSFGESKIHTQNWVVVLERSWRPGVGYLVWCVCRCRRA